MASRPTAGRDAPADPLAKAAQLGVSGSNGRAGERAREGEPGVGVVGGGSGMRKRKNHRGGKKKRHKSFAAVSSSGGRNGEEDEDDMLLDPASAASRDGFYDRTGHNRSSTSIESETLLDHRDAPFLRARRPSLATPTARQSGPFSFAQQQSPTRLRAPPPVFGGDSDDEDRGPGSWNEGAPLLSRSMMLRSGGFDIFPGGHGGASGRDYGSINNASGSNNNINNGNNINSSNSNDRKNQKHGRRNSSRSSHRRRFLNPFSASQESYNINYPPSVPGSPSQPPKDRLDHIDLSFGDEMLRDELSLSPSLPRRVTPGGDGGGAAGSGSGGGGGGTAHQDSLSSPLSQQRLQTPLTRRQTAAAEADVCFPQEGMSDLGEEDEHRGNSGGGDGITGGSGSGGSGGSGGGGSGGGAGGIGAGGIEEDYFSSQRPSRGARRHRRKWPDLVILNEWSRLEKEGHNEERRAKKITEPQLVNGRLRPVHKGWHRAEEDAPYRFTYFNEEFQSTIHSQTISELVQPGGSFRELFVPDPPLLSDSESEDEGGDEEGEMEDEDEEVEVVVGADLSRLPSPLIAPTRPELLFMNGGAVGGGGSVIKSPPQIKSPLQVKSPPQVRSPPPPQIKSPRLTGSPAQRERDIQTVLAAEAAAAQPAKAPRYGERPVWWLDVLSPTEAEMKVLSKTFGIHPLTAEDIIMQETREKVELFRNYYFVSYRSFDQDPNSDTFLDPVNMYVVVFREGVLSFHFSMTPHPANVRRRIRQLRDYMMLSSDWVSYAIIDDITDVFLPLIQKIEEEVDDIDDAILKMHEEGADSKSSSAETATTATSKRKDKHEKPAGEAAAATGADGSGPSASTAVSDSNMLRHVGDCRKRVMSLYRLLGNKADVIKGFAKRCNEHWEVAPRSEIGLYLGDIQDHIVTMTGNLSHYEKILSRAHGNYLAQINIRMNERQEQTADVLGKLTVLGTIIVPMNIITGLWGMNVWVPGQSYEGDLQYFFWITGFLILFGIFCYVLAKRVYKIV